MPESQIPRPSEDDCDHKGADESFGPTHTFEFDSIERRNVWNPFAAQCRKCSITLGEALHHAEVEFAALQPKYESSQEALREGLNEHADFQARIEGSPVGWALLDKDGTHLAPMMFGEEREPPLDIVHMRLGAGWRRVRLVEEP